MYWASMQVQSLQVALNAVASLKISSSRLYSLSACMPCRSATLIFLFNVYFGCYFYRCQCNLWTVITYLQTRSNSDFFISWTPFKTLKSFLCRRFYLSYCWIDMLQGLLTFGYISDISLFVNWNHLSSNTHGQSFFISRMPFKTLEISSLPFLCNNT